MCFFLRCLDLKEILAAASHLLPVRCQQTMLVPTNITGGFQEEFWGKKPESTEMAFSLLMTHTFRAQIRRKPLFLWKVGPWNKVRPTTGPSLLHPTSCHFWQYQRKEAVGMIQEVGQHIELITHCGEFGCLPVFCRLFPWPWLKNSKNLLLRSMEQAFQGWPENGSAS